MRSLGEPRPCPRLALQLAPGRRQRASLPRRRHLRQQRQPHRRHQHPELQPAEQRVVQAGHPAGAALRGGLRRPQQPHLRGGRLRLDGAHQAEVGGDVRRGAGRGAARRQYPATAHRTCLLHRHHLRLLPQSPHV